MAFLREHPRTELEQLGVTVPGGQGAAPAVAAAGGMGTPAPAAESSSRTLRIAVSLDPALAGRLKPGTVVFVSAREAGIPGPPLAAVRVNSDDLPATVVLSATVVT